MNPPSGRPPARRTFGARPLTRAALLLLVAGVLLAALLGQLTGRDRSTAPARPAGPVVTTTAGPVVTTTAGP